jgi:hypothetical protein
MVVADAGYLETVDTLVGDVRVDQDDLVRAGIADFLDLSNN